MVSKFPVTIKIIYLQEVEAIVECLKVGCSKGPQYLNLLNYAHNQRKGWQ